VFHGNYGGPHHPETQQTFAETFSKRPVDRLDWIYFNHDERFWHAKNALERSQADEILIADLEDFVQREPFGWNLVKARISAEGFRAKRLVDKYLGEEYLYTPE